MRDRTPLPQDANYRREFHPERLDLDQFAAAIRLLLAPQKHRESDLHSLPDQGIHVVTH